MSLEQEIQLLRDENEKLKVEIIQLRSRLVKCLEKQTKTSRKKWQDHCDSLPYEEDERR
jgi:hypothetical protein